MKHYLVDLLELKSLIHGTIKSILREDPMSSVLGMRQQVVNKAQSITKAREAEKALTPRVETPAEIAYKDRSTKIMDTIKTLEARKRIDSMKPIPKEDLPVEDYKYEVGSNKKNFFHNKLVQMSNPHREVQTSEKTTRTTNNPYKVKFEKTEKEMKKLHGDSVKSFLTAQNHREKMGWDKKESEWDKKYANDKVYKDTLDALVPEQRKMFEDPNKHKLDINNPNHTYDAWKKKTSARDTKLSAAVSESVDYKAVLDKVNDILKGF